MAWILELAVECNNDREAGDRVRQHFEAYEFNLEATRVVRCGAGDPELDEDGRWWVDIVPMLAGKAFHHNEDISFLTKIALCLYERLRTASGYRFAIVGIESYQFNRAEALSRMIHNSKLNLDGLVVNEELFRTFGDAPDFLDFAPGYFWRPLRHLAIVQ